MKKGFLYLATALLGCASVFAGGAKEDASEVKHLTFMINYQASEDVTMKIEEIVDDFNVSQDGIEVELIPGSSDYEAIMKSKMATNDLPDLFTTHGWSVMRYSEYLSPLEGESWVADIHPAIKPVITDSNGQIYVLPMDVDMAGVAYNKDVLAKAGVNVDSLKTWKDLYIAMDKIKAIGVTPIHIGGKDNWPVGNFLDWAAPSVFVTDKNNDSSADLLAGTLDTQKWNLLGQLMIELKEKEYLNVDCLTSTYSDSARALAVGDAAFAFYGNYVNGEAWSFNPEANLGFFPVPAYYEGDEPSLISGERTAVGIWKDSPNSEAAHTFLSFLAQPENIAKVATANGIPTGLINAVSDTGKLKADYEKWANIEAFPYFDRAYLPGGMWDTMCSTGAGLLSGDMSVEKASAKVNEDFNRLYK